jgi:hypothetical protein
MKKEGVLLFVFLLILFSLIFVSAQNTTEEKAYTCLKGKVKDKCPSLTVEEQAFSLLALADNSAIQSECKSALKSKSNDNECWPSTCNIKDTSLALLSLNNIGENTDKIETWLLNKKKIPSELEWYLEIEASQATSCTISYDSSKSTIKIDENKKISANAGSCLTRAYDNYWLKIDSSCLNKNFTVSCDKDFISTLLYKKTLGQTWYVSSDVKSASAGGTTENAVNSLCFGLNACDYEGSLWASLALQKSGNDIDKFLPYLIALSDDNEKYFSSSFLYYLTNSDEYLQQVLTLQKTDGYWDLSGSRYYDTALALLSLSESQAESNAISWLGTNQGNDGCWNNDNKRDTAFLLWAAYPKQPIIARNDSGTANCESYNHYCTTNSECLDAGGNKLDNFFCTSPKICCDKPATETCKEKTGQICPSGQICSIPTIVTSDTQNCCLGNCKQKTTECEDSNLTCRVSCLSDEQEASYNCDSGDFCCQEKKGGGGIPWYVWILILLVILVVLAIIFRNRLKVMLFKAKGGFKKSPVTTTRPPFLPPSGVPAGLRRPTMMPRPMPARAIPRTIKTASKTDKELEETLKKLKEMSK